MRKVTTFALAAFALGAGGVAVAATLNERDLLQAIEKTQTAEAAQGAVASVDTAEWVEIKVVSNREVTGVVRIKKTDAQWAAIVAAVKAAAVARQTEADGELTNLGVTRKVR
jgi:hypothetical protein